MNAGTGDEIAATTQLKWARDGISQMGYDCSNPSAIGW